MSGSEPVAHPSRGYPCHLAIQASIRDTDALGHVNNAVYLSWLEEVRARYVFERRRYRTVADLDFILASASLEFRSPVAVLEWVDLWCGPSRVGGKSWELTYEGRARADGRLVVEGRTVQVQFDYAKGTPVPIPEAWRRILTAELLPAPPTGSRG